MDVQVGVLVRMLNCGYMTLAIGLIHPVQMNFFIRDCLMVLNIKKLRTIPTLWELYGLSMNITQLTKIQERSNLIIQKLIIKE